VALDPRDYLLLAALLVAAYLVLQVLRLRRSITRKSVDDARREALTRTRTEPVSVGAEISDAEFADQLTKSTLNLEIARLRRELASMGNDVARLSEEVRQLKSTHNVSPIYSEAMSMAERGELPAGIAARCGISLGEAELVAALARREFGATDRAEREDPYRDTGI